MRLLADENVPRGIIDILQSKGHDVLWARTDCPGLKDPVLLERAVADNRLVLTLDKDFWQLVFNNRVLSRIPESFGFGLIPPSPRIWNH